MDIHDVQRSYGLVSPLDYRYGRQEAKSIFTEEERLKSLMLVEYAAAVSESSFGIIPEGVPGDIAKVIKGGLITLEEVKAVEANINHDVMAMVRVLSSKAGNSGGFVHYGLTSNDVNDTATALQLKSFSAVFLDSLLQLQGVLSSMVEKYARTPMLGRTHGQHASPITFGLKMAVFLGEVNRHIERYIEASRRFLVGKAMGPVGTGAFMGRKALAVQDMAMGILGLSSETNPTQLVGRDRYVEYLSVMNNITVTVEKLATEIRNLQRPEIGEVSEHFNVDSQVGSSSMPSKKNPVDSETVCSLSRLVRSFVLPEYEASVYWHERDLTNSALERFTIPYSSILTDFVVNRIAVILSNTDVNSERMLSNLKGNRLSMSESIVKLLTSKGMSRQDAHEAVRKVSMKSAGSVSSYSSLIIETIRGVELTKKEVLNALNPRKFLGVSPLVCRQTLRRTDAVRHKAQKLEVELKRSPL